MRKQLAKIEGERKRFTATIARLGKKNNFKGPPSETVLLTNICSADGTELTAHLWFTIGKTLAVVFNNVGKKIAFDARVTTYSKGHKGLPILKAQTTDFKLSNPTNVAILPNNM